MRCILLIAILLSGCGVKSAREASRAPASESANQIGMAIRDPLDAKRDASEDVYFKDEAGESDDKPLKRKIVYTAVIDLVVEHFAPVPEKIQKLVKQFDGFVAKSDVRGTSGQQRSGSWTVRVPVDRYEAFLTAAEKLGEVRGIQSDSSDVSEEFYDVEARIRNKKQEEERLLEHLKISTAKLEEILAVEEALSRVRGEIERMEGRLRVLTDLTDLTTVTLQVEEIRNYVPDEAPTYGTRLRRKFARSIAALVTAIQDFSIALVAALPWLAVCGIPPVLIAWFFVRRSRRRAKPQVAEPRPT